MPKLKFDQLANSLDLENIRGKALQREPIRHREKFHIENFDWTDRQKEFINIALAKESKILFAKGPAGCSKTLLSVYCALHLLNEGKVSEIVYIRSAVESSDSRMGFLPGDADQKLHFYNLPFLHKMEELVCPNVIKKLQKDERVSTYPVNFCRGMSWNSKCLIFDECQNSTLKEIVTVLTRLGMGSKCFVLADPAQTDLKNGARGGYEKIQSVFGDEESEEFGINTFEFDETDVVRSELVKFLVTKFKDLSVNPHT
jgi:phosphate starvation-inducible protein PhoH|tara:strand:+ start:1252 stop:2022 length:771 start_codon:yes stop_codon:yes gene_type:complete